MPSATAILHVAFEDLGTLEPVLKSAGFRVKQLDASTYDFQQADPIEPDLLIVMGGPIGVYETQAYPFLREEIGFLQKRLAAGKPTLGICLGAQLMAAALGARVYPGKNGKEIGWAALQPGCDTHRFPWLKNLFAKDLKVLHWHGDTFDLPAGAFHLAKTSQYENQAFAVGDYALALQFHPEVSGHTLERWYVGHCCELNVAGIPVPQLRQASMKHAPPLENIAQDLWKEWLKSLSFG